MVAIDLEIKTTTLPTGVIVPDKKGKDSVRATFRVMTFGEYNSIELLVNKVSADIRGNPIVNSDYQEMRRQFLRRMLLSLSLPISLEFDNGTGWLTDSSFHKVASLPAPLISKLLDLYERTMDIDKKEVQLIERQSAILFSKNSQGVRNACEAVNMFCNYGNFWDKFGMNRKELSDLPYRDYLRLRIVLSNESHFHRPGNTDDMTPKAKIVGAGGRVRPSRATIIRDH